MARSIIIEIGMKMEKNGDDLSDNDHHCNPDARNDENYQILS